MSKFFSKKLVKSNLCAVFRGIARNLSWQRRNFFLSTQRNRTALFRKKRQTLYRRLWFQEFFIFFRLFSSFSIGKFGKIWSSEKFKKISQKIFFPHLPLENFLQCRAALAVRISSNTLRVANQGPLSPEQIKTFPRTYAIYMLHP